MAKLWQVLLLLATILLVLPECWAGKNKRSLQEGHHSSFDPSDNHSTSIRSTELTDGYLSNLFHTLPRPADRRRYRWALKYLLEQLDLEVLPTAPGGDDLFDALRQQLKPGSVSAEGLRNWISREAFAIHQRSERHAPCSREEKVFWQNYSALYGGRIEPLQEGLRFTRIWANAKIVIPLAAFVLDRQVIQVNPSNEHPWYEILAVDKNGDVIGENKWQQLLSQDTLFLINDGSGHYEGATPVVTKEIAVVTEPLDVEQDVFRAEQPIVIHEGTDSVKKNRIDSSVYSEPESVMEAQLQPVGTNIVNWLQEVEYIPKKHADLKTMVQGHGLKIVGGGAPQVAGGFYGALMAGFSRRKILNYETLNDVSFLQEVRMVFERTQYQPLLGRMVDDALAFCLPEESKRRHVLEQALHDLNRMSEDVWMSPCLLVALSSLYDTPLVLMHSYAADGMSLLYQPWKAVVGVPDEQLDTVIKTRQPVVLIHNGGKRPLARWKTATFPPSDPPRFGSAQESLVQKLVFVLAPYIKGEATTAKDNFSLLGGESLPREYYKYLKMRIAVSDTSRSDDLYSLLIDVRKIANSQTHGEWKAIWHLLEGFLLQKLERFDQAAHVFTEQENSVDTPDYLRPYILELHAHMALFRQRDSKLAQEILEGGQLLTEKFGLLAGLLAMAYSANKSVEKEMQLLSKLVKKNPYGGNWVVALASAYLNRGGPKRAIELLTHIPEYRENSAVTRALAAAYSGNGQIHEALDLLSFICSTSNENANMGVLLNTLSRCRDRNILNNCLPIIEAVADRELVTKSQKVSSQLSVNVSLGAYKDARTLHLLETRYLDPTLDALKQESRYRHQQSEFDHVIGLATEILELDPDDKFVWDQALGLEQKHQVATVSRIYAKNCEIVFKKPYPNANAMVFFEKHPKQAKVFFPGKVPECLPCYLWHKHTESHRCDTSCSGLAEVFDRHLNNMKSKGALHKRVRSCKDIRFLDVNAYDRHVDKFSRLTGPIAPQPLFRTPPVRDSSSFLVRPSGRRKY